MRGRTIAWIAAGGILLLVLFSGNWRDYEIIIGGALVLVVVIPLWALVRTFRLRRSVNENAEELEALKRKIAGFEHQRLPELIKRIYELEQALERAPARPAEQTSAVAPPPVPRPSAAAPPPPQAIAPPTIITSDYIVEPPAARPPRAVIPSEPGAARPAPAAAEGGASRWANLEELLGTNILNKIGVAIFVLGGGFLTNLAMQEFGPVGRVTLLYAISAAFLAAGVTGESREVYRILARGLLGGGWALAYTTTYALHNVEAVRLVESPGVGFFLLFLVAAGMVLHSLRYQSEVVTGLAYAVAFASVALSRMNIGTMGATALLAASLVVVLWRQRWYHLEPLAILATYGVHWVWLWQVFEYIGGHRPFPDSTASSVLLTLYWLMYLVSHFLRGEEEPVQKLSLTISFVLNAGGFLAVMGYQSLYPHLKFWFLLGVGIGYLALAWVTWSMGRRLGFLLHSTLGSALTLVAVPYRYGGARLELVWLAEAQALLYVGLRAADAHLRKLGWAALAVLVTYVTFHDLSPRMAYWAPPNYALGSLLAALAAAFYFNARLAPRLLEESADETDRLAAQVSAPVATGFLAAAIWVAMPFMWPGFVWAVAALGLAEIGRRVDAPYGDAILRGCGHGLAFAAAIRLLAINLQYAPPAMGVSLRVVTIALACALFYYSARRIAPAIEPASEEITGHAFGALRSFEVSAVYTWLATALIALMLWYELTSTTVAVAWALLGLAVLEGGSALGDRPLAAQGQMLLALSFIRMCVADLNAEVMLGPFSARMLTVPILALAYYYAGFAEPGHASRMRRAFLWLGTISVAALLRFELPPEWVAVSWAGLVVALFLIERRIQIPALRNQSVLFTLLAGARCGLDNLYQTAAWGFTNARTVTVLIVCGLLAVPLGVSLRERGTARAWAAEGAGEEQVAPVRRWWRTLAHNPHQLFFFVPVILLTALLWFEVRRPYVTGAWALEALALFVISLKLGERSYRRFSLALFLFCVGRIVAVDAWSLDKLGRVIAFMGLGLALILVGYLYTRFQEAWRKYL